ncbi:MAG: acyltransferase [Myxococcota bacterium]
MTAPFNPVARPYYRHETAEVDGESEANDFCDPKIGRGTKIWHHAHVMRGAQVGPHSVLGQNSYIAATAIVGEGCRLQNNVNVYDGVRLGNYVFCGPQMTFTNLSTPLPRAAISRRDSYQNTIVGDHASFGAASVVICGTQIGEGAFIAAGAVVTRDVPAFTIVAGCPARPLGWACLCGARLNFTGKNSNSYRCEAEVPPHIGHPGGCCGRVFTRDKEGLVALENRT